MKDEVNAFEDNRLDIHDFTKISLCSTQDPLQRNLSSVSDILGPNNSADSKENNVD